MSKYLLEIKAYCSTFVVNSVSFLFIFFSFLDVKITGDNMALQTVKYRQDRLKQT